MSFKPIFIALILLLGVTGHAYVHAEKPVESQEQANLEGKEIDGEVYIKASSLLNVFGGEGKIDANTGTYSYQRENPVSKVVEQISPSVVAIIGKPSDIKSPSSDDRFRLAHGTGIILKSDGLIVTNAHVVKDLKNIVVVTSDGKQYAGATKLIDEESDLALLQIEASGLTAAVLPEKSNVQVGETVIAIGTPISFALRNTVTVGVISGTDRSIHSTYRLLQTDAAINPGNSGGALVNLKGEVIGINSLKFAATGVESLGFAIPTDTVKYIINQYTQYGKVNRPYLGFELEESWTAVVGLPSSDPLKVTHVGKTAQTAGIKKDDILFSINNININTIVDLNELLKQFIPGQTVTLMMQSDGDLVQRELTLSAENN